ncbi:holin-like protein CidA [Brevibacillus agri]|uniref:CidA/LrgA family holin-like protein n=1 Tax=Brevibacillus agri TaxID=51101 RepID=A0A3M8BD07_9BACL|nr:MULTISPECIES: CidA/LrgA family holin-like protein [Brevibacillus]ELK43851.1 LrgA family protein [Brevibacillus agri BAB-2500]EJL44216.1 putative effector of murein hydrolase LrgA [Brevibacillus sp. CF112]MBG9563964.1 holin [Brevibacillus agri]MBY0052895.1 CidA/LrgA family holin-like protein [Brevibacillus agri]MCG5254482.1 CidA/LrgA family holin-like protein [Brevibacillus agri]
MKRLLIIVGQVAFFIIVSALMNLLVSVLGWKIPGSILGMFVVFLLLQAKVLRLEWIESGAAWLMAELLLFFIPPSVGIVSYQSLMLHEGLQIVLIIVIGTAFVMACSGLIAQSISKRKEHSRS